MSHRLDGTSPPSTPLHKTAGRQDRRSTNIVELGGAVYCAWVLRDSLLVGDTKRRLKIDVGTTVASANKPDCH